MEKTFQEKVAEACAEVSAISAQEAYARKQQDVVFIDPREPSDIQATTGTIPGALNLSLSELEAEGELPPQLADRNRSIVSACQAGPMGALAAYALKMRGYTNVRYVDGGTQAWLDAGFATIK